MEKGYLHWGHDIGIEENPFEAGVGFCVNFKKESPFLGQAALEEKKDSAMKKRKVNFAISNNDLLMYHNEPIFFDGKIVGEITSGKIGLFTKLPSFTFASFCLRRKSCKYVTRRS